MKDTFSKYIKEILLLLIISLSVALAKAIHTAVVLPLYAANKTEELATITSLSVCLLFVSLAFSVYLMLTRKKKDIKENFTFDEKLGFYKHKKTGKSSVLLV